MKECSRYLRDKVKTFKGCCEYFQLIDTFKELGAFQEILKECSKILIDYFVDVESLLEGKQKEKLAEFVDLNPKALGALLKSDALKVCCRRK